MDKNVYTPAALDILSKLPDSIKDDTKIASFQQSRIIEFFGSVSAESDGPVDVSDRNVFIFEEFGLRLDTNGYYESAKYYARSCQPTVALVPHFGSKVLFSAPVSCVRGVDAGGSTTFGFNHGWIHSKVPLNCYDHQDETCPLEKERQEMMKKKKELEDIGQKMDEISMSDNGKGNMDKNTYTPAAKAILAKQPICKNEDIAIQMPQDIFGSVSADSDGVDTSDPRVFTLETLGLRVDTNGYDNLGEHLQRSCQPNFGLKPIPGSKVLLTVIIVAIRWCKAGELVTIPFNSDWMDSSVPLVCGIHVKGPCPFEEQRLKALARKNESNGSGDQKNKDTTSQP